MATAVGSTKPKGPLIDPGLCRCCRSIKKCRLLSTEYEWMGNREVYSDMIMDCFGLLLSHLDAEDTKDTCICATCVTRLRDASAFRTQVLQCEQAFMSFKLDYQKDDAELDRKMEVLVKIEPTTTSDADEDLHNDGQIDAMDLDSDEAKEEGKIKKKSARKARVTRSLTKKKSKQDKSLKKELLSEMKKMKNKLNKKLTQPEEETSAPKQPKATPAELYEDHAPTKQKKSTDDQEFMAYNNSIVIVHNSYVWPFLTRVSNYYCYYCKDQFTDPNDLREHTLTHDPKTFERLMENKKIPKMDITRIDCRLCTERIDDLPSFKHHLRTTHGKVVHEIDNEFLKFKLSLDNMKCTECDSQFPYFDQLKKHMVEHFGSYICDMCGACFMEQSSLATHIKSHNKVETYFPCEVCGKNLKSKYSKYLHIATVHEKKPTVNCYKCEAIFMSYALRNRHLIEVHGDKRTFPCKLCDKVYNRRKTLMEHNRRNHLKVFRHQCDLCEQRFYLPSRLKEHMATHTGERNFRCEFCDKSYPRLQSLQEHVRSHSSERRYKCDICSSTFTQNGSLKNHMKSHHQDFGLEGAYN